MQDEAPRFAPDVPRDHLAFRHQDEPDRPRGVAQGLIVTLSLGDDHGGVDEPGTKRLGAVLEYGTGGVGAVVEDLDETGQPSRLDISTKGIVEDRLPPDHNSHPERVE